MRCSRTRRVASGAVVLLGLACGEAAEPVSVAAEDTAVTADVATVVDVGPETPKGCIRRDPQRLPFFGDLHVHTALSLDANLQGTRLRPSDAYRFARGEAVGLAPYDAEGRARRTLQLERPLDFVAVSDHAEFLGLVTTCLTPGLDGYDSAECDMYRSQPDVAYFVLNGLTSASQDSAGHGAPCVSGNEHCGAAARSTWQEVVAAAEAANDASEECAFTAFVAYEWSASPGTRNLHRNVIFRTGEVPELPFSYFDGTEEEALWDALESGCRAESGCEALTIPHNSNLSAGLMFEPVDRESRPIDAAYAERRARMEPLVEVFQHKGSSECLPELAADEECAFERLPWNTLASAALAGPPDKVVASDTVLDALGQGLALQRSLGMDPFQYGLVASTDTHLATPGAVDEQSYPGHGGAGNSPGVAAELVDKVWFNPGGLAVLWAEENTRDALFAAMKRREAYATSGPRIVLRVAAGPDVPTGLCESTDFFGESGLGGDAPTAVPMGGVLPPESKRLRLAIRAAMDPGTAARPGARLERLQVVKGWLDGAAVKYQVFDVAVGELVGNAVDPTTCRPAEVGPPELCAVWEDPAFSADAPAFWYVRVIENPTCRWQAWGCRDVDCAGEVPKGFEGCCKGAPLTQRERAWSSPVFFGISPPAVQ